MKLEEPGRAIAVAAGLIAAIVASCEAGSGGHLVEDLPLAPLEQCPEPICPEPICPACPSCLEPAQGARADPAPASAGPVDLNTATASELDTLPGVGRATAERILAHRTRRPFRRPRDLMRVKGIGPSKYKRLAPHITVGPVP